MPIPIVTLRVPDGSDSVTCTNCNEEIYVVNKPSKAGENRLYCPGEGCGAVLKLYTESGQELNHWWAGLDTFMAREVGKLFRVARFPSRTVAEQWHEFEMKYPETTIIGAARFLQSKLKPGPSGTRFWKDIIAMVEKREGRAPANSETVTDEQIIFSMPPELPEGERY